MTIINKKQASRRCVLKGIGVSLTLPLMESLMPRVAFGAATPVNAQRMAVVTVPFGMVVDNFHPAQAGTKYELPSTLRPFNKLYDDFTVFSNLITTFAAGTRRITHCSAA
jgi:hypothetical protein